jgi:hypothetical protein
MKQITPRLAVLLSALIFGVIEAFTFSHGLHTGAPDFLGVWVLGYHLPMAALMLLICIGAGQFQMFPVWVLFEDMSYFYFSKELLTPNSWVCAGLGGIHPNVYFIPTVYILLFVGWLLLEVARWYLVPQKKK